MVKLSNVLEKYEDDPLYQAVFNAKNREEYDKAVETLKSIRGVAAWRKLLYELKEPFREVEAS